MEVWQKNPFYDNYLRVFRAFCSLSYTGIVTITVTFLAAVVCQELHEMTESLVWELPENAGINDILGRFVF
jgi:hypothetical protein